MKILIIGSGGREHALAWKCAQSPQVKNVFVAPGNAGTAREDNGITNIDISFDDINRLAEFAIQNKINLTIVGPEVALSSGIVDRFNEDKLPIFGPTRKATRIETSKLFCKKFMLRHKIPTANYQWFDDPQGAQAYIKEAKLPIVIKADGLAAGKGVIIASTTAEAHDAIDLMLKQKQLGEAGSTIVIEDFLHGEEASFICLSDGKNLLPLASSQDHKKRDEGDRGPNTGGMGAYSPTSVISDEIQTQVMERIMQPTIMGMAQEGNPFVGFLYAGLMIDANGQASVVEFNSRMGDPETQPLLVRMRSDLVDLCLLALQDKLDTASVEWDPQVALAVVLATKDYPNNYPKGQTINGLNQIDSQHTKIFHAGTREKDGQIVTNGGRVLTVVSLGKDIREAQDRAYENCRRIQWEGLFYRKDIGWRAFNN